MFILCDEKENNRLSLIILWVFLSSVQNEGSSLWLKCKHANINWSLCFHTHSEAGEGGISPTPVRPKQTWVVHACHYIPTGKKANTECYGKWIPPWWQSTRGAVSLAGDKLWTLSEAQITWKWEFKLSQRQRRRGSATVKIYCEE